MEGGASVDEGEPLSFIVQPIITLIWNLSTYQPIRCNHSPQHSLLNGYAHVVLIISNGAALLLTRL